MLETRLARESVHRHTEPRRRLEKRFLVVDGKAGRGHDIGAGEHRTIELGAGAIGEVADERGWLILHRGLRGHGAR